MRLHLIDGTYELFRAHYSKRPGFKGPDGQDLKATVGVASSLLALLHEEAEAVTHIAVAFDNPIRSFRNDLFAGYKTEEGVDPALLAQFDAVEEATRALGVTVWSMDRFEADDALATGAARFRQDVAQVRIMTPDKDLGQCLDGDRVVQVDRAQGRVIDAATLRTVRGVAPAQIPDLLALIGDDADGIPGIPGIGAKTAAALLDAFGRLEQIPDDPRSWPSAIRGAERLARVLAEQRDNALLYRKLATLVSDVPLPEQLADLRFQGVPRQQFEAWCDALGVRTLKARPARWAET
ncbi:5'-3' exonuclease [Chondromyces apiculatus]|uniref:DNA polymerase I 5'-3' exonuclease domain protein n=1 Tax=Chondromyces apiculatus DSM 436 TaxID=1192034 RepID=A0A017TDB3_9BACT|nr:5'-3' exonuclease H3TH domain-containing protein [Chondromyces apiculatus]EYF06556.1 DNA polymerase I 5'-3' exonuclease domain protein [Chondromyces apiculatus DSM 436]